MMRMSLEAKSSSALERRTSVPRLDRRAWERLAGAAIVVAAVVVGVPEVLRGTVESLAHAPERPPLPPNVTAVRDEARSSASAQGSQLRGAARSLRRAAQSAASAPAPAPAAPPPGEVAPAGPWTVQIGSFASPANARRLATRLTAEGFPMSVNGSSVAGRTLYRVRAVATGDRAAMQALAEQLRVAGHTGTVLPR
jgi:cell division septation protein DedD